MNICIDERNVDLLTTKEQIASIVYGLAIGDALGVPVEFMERGTYSLDGMIGYGTHHQPPGTWSDDTSLTLALLEHVGTKSTLSDLMDTFEKYRWGYLTPHDECFDIGMATDRAIDRYLNGIQPEEAGGREEHDNGNGALMRISPLAVLLQFEESFLRRVKAIERYTKITHAHPRSIIGSIIYIQILIDLLAHKDLTKALANTKDLILCEFSSDHPYMLEFYRNYELIFTNDFMSQSIDSIRSTGYVVDTLKAAIWCIGNTESFKEAVLKAVNLGGDTDTVGAVTGSFAGSLYGMEDIPRVWLNELSSPHIIERCITQFLKVFEG